MEWANSLIVLLYDRGLSSCVDLDRFMNIRHTIDMRSKNIFQVKAISQSYDNKIWLYDELENKLKKIDEDGKLLQETPDFRFLLSKPYSPVRILTRINLSISTTPLKVFMCLIISVHCKMAYKY